MPVQKHRKTRRRHHNNHSLHFEALEHRFALAGDVTAAFSGDTLLLTGDDDANQLTITQISATQIHIEGDGGTTINGSAWFNLDFANARLKIQLQGGDDTISIGDGTTVINLKSLSLDAGAGADSVNLDTVHVTANGTADVILGDNAQVEADTFHATDVSVGGNLNVRLGGGDNEASLGTVVVGRNLSLFGGAGADTATLNTVSMNGRLNLNLDAGDNSVAVDGSSVSRNLTVDTRDGADEVAITGSIIRGTVDLRLGDGDNAVNLAGLLVGRNLSMTGRAGIDSATVADVNVVGNAALNLGDNGNVVVVNNNLLVGKDLSVRAGVGDDEVSLMNAVAFGRLNLLTGDGRDALALETVSVGKKLTIDAGGDDDNLTLTAVAADRAAIRLGDGANALMATNLSFLNSLRLDGGRDLDTVTLNSLLVATGDIRLSDGDDILNIEGLSKNGLHDHADVNIDVGEGDDELGFLDMTAVTGRVRLGNGTNSLSADVIDAFDAQIFGGSGVDTVNLTNSNFLKLTGFFYGGDDVVDADTVQIVDEVTLDGGRGANTLNQTNVTLPAVPANIRISNF